MTRYYRSRLICASLCGLLFLQTAAYAQDEGSSELTTSTTTVSEEDQQAVDEVGEALRSQWSAKWYDAKEDELRPIRFQQQPAQKKTNSSFWNELWNWLDSFNVVSVFKFLAWLLLFATIAALLYFLYQTLTAKRTKADTEQQMPIRRGPQRAERIEELPVALNASEGDFLDQADRLRRQGDLSGAIVRLFSYQLLQLDHAEYLRLVKGKTNRLYLRELRRNAPGKQKLASIFADTIQLFEETYFGGRTPTQEAFEICWQASQGFQSLIETQEVQAA